jgi:hypothetical protein
VTWFDQRFALSTLTWCIWYRRNHVVTQGTALWAWAMTKCVYWNFRILTFLCWWSLNDLFSELVCGSMTTCVYWNFRILTFLCWWFLNDLFSEVAYCFLNSRFRANQALLVFLNAVCLAEKQHMSVSWPVVFPTEVWTHDQQIQHRCGWHNWWK